MGFFNTIKKTVNKGKEYKKSYEEMVDNNRRGQIKRLNYQIGRESLAIQVVAKKEQLNNIKAKKEKSKPKSIFEGDNKSIFD